MIICHIDFSPLESGKFLFHVDSKLQLHHINTNRKKKGDVGSLRNDE